MMSGASLMILDEPTTGLDASTSLEVISAIRTVCNVMRTPVIVALLQPSPEVPFVAYIIYIIPFENLDMQFV